MHEAAHDAPLLNTPTKPLRGWPLCEVQAGGAARAGAAPQHLLPALHALYAGKGAACWPLLSFPWFPGSPPLGPRLGSLACEIFILLSFFHAAAALLLYSLLGLVGVHWQGVHLFVSLAQPAWTQARGSMQAAAILQQSKIIRLAILWQSTLKAVLPEKTSSCCRAG
jgi:hypothetical protein